MKLSFIFKCQTAFQVTLFRQKCNENHPNFINVIHQTATHYYCSIFIITYQTLDAASSSYVIVTFKEI